MQALADIVVGLSRNEVGRLEVQGADDTVFAGRPVLAGNSSHPLSVHSLVRRELMPGDPNGTDAVTESSVGFWDAALVEHCNSLNIYI